MEIQPLGAFLHSPSHFFRHLTAVYNTKSRKNRRKRWVREQVSRNPGPRELSWCRVAHPANSWSKLYSMTTSARGSLVEFPEDSAGHCTTIWLLQISARPPRHRVGAALHFDPPPYTSGICEGVLLIFLRLPARFKTTLTSEVALLPFCGLMIHKTCLGTPHIARKFICMSETTLEQWIASGNPLHRRCW
jgi:hypothetical protein